MMDFNSATAAQKQEMLVAILEAASQEPIGLVLNVSDLTMARAALYGARTKAADPAFADLQFRQWPYDDGNLVICHSRKAPAKANNLSAVDLSGVLDLDLE